MFLLRYGIRFFLHYSVPLTLGLLAYSEFRSDPAAVAKRSDGASSAEKPLEVATASGGEPRDSGADSSTEGPPSAPATAELAKQAGEASDAAPLPIAAAEASKPAEASAPEPAPAKVENEKTAETKESQKSSPPMDRSIDATGHETPVIAATAGAAAAAAIASSELPTDSDTNEAVEPERGSPIEAAAVSAATSMHSAKTITEAEKNSLIASTNTETAETAAAKDRLPSDKDVSVSKLETAPVPEEPLSSDHVPADLKPEVRAIAAEVPKAPDRASVASAANDSSSDSANDKPDASAPLANLPRKADDSGKESATGPAVLAISTPIPTDRADADKPKAFEKKELPDFVVAEDGETWSRLAQRLYGDESLGEALWRENRDAHGKSAETPPIVGRMIRLPAPAQPFLRSSPQTDLARKSR
jgi:hypothetical protein